MLNVTWLCFDLKRLKLRRMRKVNKEQVKKWIADRISIEWGYPVPPDVEMLEDGSVVLKEDLVKNLSLGNGTTYMMTKKEAIEEMKKGSKITHRHFAAHEWMSIEGTQLIFEDGVKLSQTEFWKYRKDKTWSNDYFLFMLHVKATLRKEIKQLEEYLKTEHNKSIFDDIQSQIDEHQQAIENLSLGGVVKSVCEHKKAFKSNIVFNRMYCPECNEYLN